MATLKDEIARWTQGATKPGMPSGAPVARPDAQGAGARPPAEALNAAASSAASSANYYVLKKQLHHRLLARMDLSSIESLSTEQLQSQLSTTLWALLQEEALPLNEQEKVRLVSDLKNEIMGL